MCNELEKNSLLCATRSSILCAFGLYTRLNIASCFLLGSCSTMPLYINLEDGGIANEDVNDFRFDLGLDHCYSTIFVPICCS